MLVVVPFGAKPPQASAAEVLHRAADTARAQPDADPATNQFLYKKVALPQDRSYELWLSVDGTRDGRYLQNGQSNPVYGCRGGKRLVLSRGERPVEAVECEVSGTENADVLVFDPETYEYLGSGHDAVLDVGIVDKVGQRP